MEYRQLGHSDLQVSAFALGSWLTYEFMTEADALAVIDSGIQAGINFLDDARYNDRTGQAPMESGYSEVVFGNLLRKGGWNRSDLIIANKLWYEFYPDESPEVEVDGSLSRLQLDYLDLVYCVPPPDSLSVPDMVQQMNDLIKTGKVRYWGFLFWSTEQIETAYQTANSNGLQAPCATQPAYSLLSKSPVEDETTRTLFSQADIGIVSSYSLYGGLLTGKYNTAESVQGRFKPEDIAAMRQRNLFEKVDQVISLAREIGCRPAQLALAYCLKNEQVSSVLFGATKAAQVEENLKALDLLPKLDQDVMNRLKQL